MNSLDKVHFSLLAADWRANKKIRRAESAQQIAMKQA